MTFPAPVSYTYCLSHLSLLWSYHFFEVCLKEHLLCGALPDCPTSPCSHPPLNPHSTACTSPLQPQALMKHLFLCQARMHRHGLDELVSGRERDTSTGELYDNLITDASELRRSLTEPLIALLGKWHIQSGPELTWVSPTSPTASGLQLTAFSGHLFYSIWSMAAIHAVPGTQTFFSFKWVPVGIEGTESPVHLQCTPR